MSLCGAFTSCDISRQIFQRDAGETPQGLSSPTVALATVHHFESKIKLPRFSNLQSINLKGNYGILQEARDRWDIHAESSKSVAWDQLLISSSTPKQHFYENILNVFCYTTPFPFLSGAILFGFSVQQKCQRTEVAMSRLRLPGSELNGIRWFCMFAQPSCHDTVV